MAFRYHPLFLITPFWFLAVIHYDNGIKKNKAINTFSICVAILLATINLLRVLRVIDCPV